MFGWFGKWCYPLTPVDKESADSGQSYRKHGLNTQKRISVLILVLVLLLIGIGGGSLGAFFGPWIAVITIGAGVISSFVIYAIIRSSGKEEAYLRFQSRMRQIAERKCND